MRYLSMVMVRLHPARDAEFADAIKLVTGNYEKINSDQPLVVYQCFRGIRRPTFSFSDGLLKTLDEAPARGRAIRESMAKECRDDAEDLGCGDGGQRKFSLHLESQG